MYSTVKDIKEYLAQGDKRPYIECEYSHAMGNSNGALHKYTELADQKDCGYQGGFIWDYIDQSIWKKDRYGKWFQAYGGDFGERPTDYNFSGNGIAYGGDRAPSPKMQESSSAIRTSPFPSTTLALKSGTRTCSPLRMLSTALLCCIVMESCISSRNCPILMLLPKSVPASRCRLWFLRSPVNMQ